LPSFFVAADDRKLDREHRAAIEKKGSMSARVVEEGQINNAKIQRKRKSKNNQMGPL
jgi:hypothetical protein